MSSVAAASTTACYSLSLKHKFFLNEGMVRHLITCVECVSLLRLTFNRANEPVFHIESKTFNVGWPELPQCNVPFE